MQTAIETQTAADIGTELTNLQTIQTQISTARAEMGNAATDLTNVGNYLETLNLSNTERLAVISDTDVAAASSELSYREYALKAAIAVAQKVMQISLQSFFD